MHWRSCPVHWLRCSLAPQSPGAQPMAACSAYRAFGIEPPDVYREACRRLKCAFIAEAAYERPTKPVGQMRDSAFRGNFVVNGEDGVKRGRSVREHWDKMRHVEEARRQAAYPHRALWLPVSTRHHCCYQLLPRQGRGPDVMLPYKFATGFESVGDIPDSHVYRTVEPSSKNFCNAIYT